MTPSVFSFQVPSGKLCAKQGDKLMDAYEAEGLLGLCVHLVKVCIVQQLLSRRTIG